ncbi:class I SAM-dependent methyltransferase [bacterium]|nr:class I SAM-dependent methyltransferase [bacterium]RQV97980.1 MAG: class I SAM-dependent methyltransferase [bacterium]
MIDAIIKWEREDGVRFLKRTGIKTGQTVLDFGARVGHYSIPAAFAVGPEGQVYAIDREQRDLNQLVRKTEALNLKNIKPVQTKGHVILDFDDASIDVILLYDVLHYLDKEKRKMLYREAYRVLKVDGWISVYPKHVIEDAPADQFRDLHWDDVKNEILNQNFQFQGKFCNTLSHDDFLIQGCVFNFFKIYHDTH